MDGTMDGAMHGAVCGVMAVVVAGAIGGCGPATPSAPPAVLISEPGEVGTAGTGGMAAVAGEAIYPAGPAVFRGTRIDEREPGAAGVPIELRRSADDASGVFTDTLVVFEPDPADAVEAEDGRLVRTNRFRRTVGGAVELIETTNHERMSTAAYEPPLLGAGAAGVDGAGVATTSDVSIDGERAGTAAMRVVYVGDEMVEVGGEAVRAARLETTFVLRPRPAVRVERSFVRWIVGRATASPRTVRERTHEVIRAGPITVSDRRFVDVWE